MSTTKKAAGMTFGCLPPLTSSESGKTMRVSHPIGTTGSYTLMHTLEVPPEDEVVSAWDSTDAIDREPFIVLPTNEPDPRVHRDNFRLARPMVEFASTRVSPGQFH